MSKWFAVAGCMFLSISIVDFLSLYAPLVSLLQQNLVFNEPADPRVIAGAISSSMVSQMASVLFYIIPILMCSMASIKYKFDARWYKITLKIFGFILLLTPIINSVIGIYVLFLGFRKKSL
ncbi:hypothetical protein [Glaciecola sp. MF2-115]|uniref:hypothetical protein n=1 Tax=Glaciecola sp. MF2-115 TaxID=3384827 RepID=UPI0039A0CC74